jgi:hypothetical protein
VIEALAVLYGMLSVAWFLLVVSVCVVVYRATRLRSLPWIAAHYLIAAIAFFPSVYLARHTTFPQAQEITHPLPLTPENLLHAGWMCIDSLSSLLLAIIAFSEVAFLILKSFPETRSLLLELLLKAHQRLRIFGTALIVLTILEPTIVFILHCLHPRP